MTRPTDQAAHTNPASDSLSLQFDLPHPPEKIWRALTDPALLAEWLLPVIGFPSDKLEPGAAFTFKTQPYPGWDGTVNCRILPGTPAGEPRKGPGIVPGTPDGAAESTDTRPTDGRPTDGRLTDETKASRLPRS